jgi:hypothetical protein
VLDYVLRDGGRVRTFLFVVDDSSAAAGVLRIHSVWDVTPTP